MFLKSERERSVLQVAFAKHQTIQATQKTHGNEVRLAARDMHQLRHEAVIKNPNNCLLNHPTKDLIDLNEKDPKLAGEKFTNNKQCELVFGSGYKICSYMPVCTRLWCSTGDENLGCRTQHMPWADGTECSEGHWCQKGQCVPIDRTALKPQNGGWSHWSSFGPCSRTCGGGIQNRTRECDSPRPRNGGKFCTGVRIDYRACNTQPCPDSRYNFREQQCREHDGQNFDVPNLEQNVRWTSKYGTTAEEQCKLYCRVQDQNLYFLLREKVVDGTPCTFPEDSFDMCINGQCRKAGCDYELDSDAKLDRCGVCNGDNSTCREVHGYLPLAKPTKQHKPPDNMKEFNIPQGATNINITHEGFSKERYLILCSTCDNDWVFNDPKHPPSHNSKHRLFAGVRLEYTTQGNHIERITSAFGRPLREKLTVKLIYQSNYHKVHHQGQVTYSYLIPIYPGAVYQQQQQQHNNNRRINHTITITSSTPIRIIIMTIANSNNNNNHRIAPTCDQPCSGKRRRTAICFNADTEQEVSPDNCSESVKPQDLYEPCNTQCKFYWEPGRTDCSVPCGNGTMLVEYRCVRSYLETGQKEYIDSSHCKGIQKPIGSREQCTGSCKEAVWSYSPWNTVTNRPHSFRHYLVNIAPPPHNPTDRDFLPFLSFSLSLSFSLPMCSRPFPAMSSMCMSIYIYIYVCVCVSLVLTVSQCLVFWDLLRGAYGSGSMDRSNGSVMCLPPTSPCIIYPTIHPVSHTYTHTNARTNIIILVHRPGTVIKKTMQCSCKDERQNRSANCLSGLNGFQIDDSYCAGKQEKIVVRSCTPTDCPTWEKGEPTPCSVTCGEGQRAYALQCKLNNVSVNAALCGTRPVAVLINCTMPPCESKPNQHMKTVDYQPSVEQKLPAPSSPPQPPSPPVSYAYSWKVGPWTNCSAECDGGFKKRVVYCHSSIGQKVDDRYCSNNGTRPPDQINCANVRCPTWSFGQWSQCNEECKRSRQVQCLDHRGKPSDQCATKLKPPTVESCCNFKWRITCTGTCAANGRRTSQLICKKLFPRSNDNPHPLKSGLKVADKYCANAKRPSGSKLLKKCSKPCPFRWETSPWSKCSVGCGSGRTVRNVTCTNGRKILPKACDAKLKPANTKICEAFTHCNWRITKSNRCNCKGKQHRSVKCYDEQLKVESNRCPEGQRPKKYNKCTPPPHCRNSGTGALTRSRAGTYRNCKDAQSRHRTDGEYMIQVNGTSVRIYCHGMATATPIEYLTLTSGPVENYAIYINRRAADANKCQVSDRDWTDETNSYGATHYRKIRLQLPTLQVITNDFQFTNSSGKKQSFGSAGDCYSNTGRCPQGDFAINLEGTPFRIRPRTVWKTNGVNAVIKFLVSLKPPYQKVRALCGGYCGSCSISSDTHLYLELI
ncbi:adamts-20 [Anopheles darlingi]|uniref:Adamts-20 n=1 Tax=Anopheles darlingi TaxID=43151 RepID=W5JRV2_ANODA|nr:adamts-20 [Anopheles darlingi]